MTVSQFYSSRDGLQLELKIHMPSEREAKKRLPLICLPGLMRNADDFDAFAAHFTTSAKYQRPVYAFTFRGRGRSAFDPNPENYTILQEAEDVLAGLDAFGVAHGIFVGTSRGGMVMHILAAMRPGAMQRGILNDIGPELDGAGLLQIQTFMERVPQFADWNEAEHYLKQANGKNFPQLEIADWEKWARISFKENDKGQIVANYDKNLIDGFKSLDLSQPLPNLWQQFKGLAEIPLMTIRGEYSQLLTTETLTAMGNAHPKMIKLTISDQGHAPLLETPEILKAIEDFIGKDGH